MKKLVISVVMLFALTLHVNADVIYISNFEELCLIGNHENYPLDGDYELTNHIDASPSKNMNNGQGFKPIRYFNGSYFNGSFNGNGFKIKNLYINRPEESGIGLFSRITAPAFIKNLGLDDVYISGEQNVGGLVGYTGLEKEGHATISQCYVTGTVIANNRNVGGLVGNNYAQIFDCYSTASVDLALRMGGGGVITVAGLVGNNEVMIYNSYSTGVAVYYVADPNNNDTLKQSGGGLTSGTVGSSSGHCYYDYQTSGAMTSGFGFPKTTEEMMHKATFVDWDFETIWQIDEGKDYPKLRVFESKGSSVFGGRVSRSPNNAALPRVSVNGRMLNISSPENSAYKINLVDMRGRTAASFNASGNGSFSLAKLPSGRYIAEVKTAGTKTTTAIIVQR
jgi:hypothetical protein